MTPAALLAGLGTPQPAVGNSRRPTRQQNPRRSALVSPHARTSLPARGDVCSHINAVPSTSAAAPPSAVASVADRPQQAGDKAATEDPVALTAIEFSRSAAVSSSAGSSDMRKDDFGAMGASSVISGLGRDHQQDRDVGSETQRQQPSTPAVPAPNMLLLPVTVCKTITLAPQATLADGAAALLRSLPAAIREHSDFPSGVLRLEVSLPRTATTALRWLAGQQQTAAAPQGPHFASSGPAASAGPAAAGPFLYFSGRRSSAPDTPGASAAEAATRGWSAVAGAGAAWRWCGPGGGGFDSSVVSALQRFLSPSQPRVRILGGVRFDPRRVPDPEWVPFGSHCFVLPLLELLEAEDCCLLAVTMAWDPAAAAAADTKDKQTTQSLGCSDLAAAAASAEQALRSMRPPVPVSAYGLRVSRSEPQHAPSKQEWDRHMATLLGGLQEGQDTGAPAAAALASMLDLGVARQEYLTHGQQGLDDLLAAMTLSATAAGAVRQPADGDVGDGLDAIRDLIDGKLTISDLAAAAAGGSGGGGSGGSGASSSGGGSGAAGAMATPTASVSAGASAAEDLRGAGPARAVGQQQQEQQGHSGGVPDAAGSGDEEGEGLSKVVMARRSTLQVEGPLDPLHVLLNLQERDPRAYQLYFAPGPSPLAGQADGAPSGPGSGSGSRSGSGPAFLGCTPERLYARTGRFVASEAVAGTRPRGKGGDVEQDFWLSLDLLRSAKDHAEFCTVRDWIASQLAGPCEDVAVEIRKSVLKQGSVQHLFGRVAARLRRGRNDAHLLEALHPTPAVCGRPREAALGYLEELESFDRGWYAGPFGWISGSGAEFVVAIRSGLVCDAEPAGAGAATAPGTAVESRAGGGAAAAGAGAAGAAGVAAAARTVAAGAGAAGAAPAGAAGATGAAVPSSLVHMFAGVGVVRGSDPSAEWQELDLKVRPLSSALLPAPQPALAPNVNVAWAGLLVEELCRLGVNMFCVAPGSRSSPLTHAIACHPRARLNVCIDERSLGFWALGYGRAAGRPAAVVTSSGTAVANLLPAVVEASLSGVPLLLLTADRPAELRDTAANQTIDQTKIFGGFTRWFFDLPPPAPDVPGRTVLTTASTAYRAAVASCPPGPVHLNLQFREPLAPVAVPWQTSGFMRGLGQWQASQAPYTTHISGTQLSGATAGGGGGALPAAAPISTTSLPQSSVPSAVGNGNGSFSGFGSGGADVAGLQALLAGAGRGLVVVGELIDPRDIMAARQIAAALGWPVVADVLSGLRVGAPPAPSAVPSTSPATSSPCSLYGNAVPIVHHMDHLLLGDRSWWRVLRPDVILQLGPHLTSKRLGQFMDWAALGEEGEPGSTATPPAAGVPWVYVAPHTLRHDPSHVVTHRVVLTLPEFRDAVVAPVAEAAAAAIALGSATSCGDAGAHAQAHTAHGVEAGSGRRGGAGAGSGLGVGEPSSGPAAGVGSDPWAHVSGYGRLLLQLDEAVSHEIDVALASLDSVSEPFVARTLARSLPSGSGLFIGNSMPIRDMDMYAAPPAPLAVAAQQQQRQTAPDAAAAAAAAVPAASAASHAGAAGGLFGSSVGVVGVPVAANRGASGIDGVLSTAAGFAEGLSRPATLLVGDLSFLHDINGLNLLRGGELRPPLTVVLINNSGGGIFSFLPIAASVPEDEFTPLWATPQNVDLEAMCRAQGIPHQKVSTAEGLVPALQAAWGLNRHSVVEVITDRTTNVELHRVVQAAALRAAQHAYRLAQLATAANPHTAAPPAPAYPPPPQHLPATPSTLPATAVTAAVSLRASCISWQRYRLPLAQPLTTTTAATSGAGHGWRQGLLLRVQLVWPDGRPAGHGVGEVAPLPGLHSESLEEAEVQVAALSGLLEGVAVPPSLALLGGRVGAWLRGVVGLADPAWLLPSVRFGLECAVLAAVAEALRVTLADLLLPAPGGPAVRQDRGGASGGSGSGSMVLVNGLLSPPVSDDEQADTAAARRAAAALVAAGYTAIKVKVARRPDPEADARILAAVRREVGPHVALRADANRGWPSLEQAAAFGRTAAAAGVALQFVEEPTTDPRDMAAFYEQTGIPVAADESLDEGLLAFPQPPSRSSSSNYGWPGSSFPLAGRSNSRGAAKAAGVAVSGSQGSGEGEGASGDGGGGVPSYSLCGLPTNRAAGLAAVVVKPGVVGGVETAMEAARWARRRGVQVVVSSAFESSVGLAHLAQLAAAVDALRSSTATSAATVHHGLGTLQWFCADVTSQPLQLEPHLLPPPATAAATAAEAEAETPTAATAEATSAPDCPAPFVPVQSLGVSVDQADRLLRACAAGAALRASALHGAAGAAGEASATGGDPWYTEGSAHGGILHRNISLHVELPSQQSSSSSFPSSSSSLASSTTAAFPHSTTLHTTQSAPHASQPTHGTVPPLRVRVTGLELLPPADSTAATAAGSTRGDEAGQRPQTLNHHHQGHNHQHQGGQHHQRQPRPFLFLHGFLGSSADWLPLMRALAAAGHRCVALDLPGHGCTRPVGGGGSGDGGGGHGRSDSDGAAQTAVAVAEQGDDGLDRLGAPGRDGEQAGGLEGLLPGMGTAANSIPGAAACVAAAAEQLGLRGAVVVGYSLGARVGLQVVVEAGTAGAGCCTAGDGPSAADGSGTGSGGHVSRTGAGSGVGSGTDEALWSGAVLISGTPGIKDPAQAAARAANDDRLAASLVRHGVSEFVRRWYEQPLWSTLRRHPTFSRMLARRMGNTEGTAEASQSTGSIGAKGSGGGTGGGSSSGLVLTDSAEQMAAALSGMSTGRMAPLWDRLDPWVGPPVVLVVGDLDAKFVDINTHTLARLLRHRTAPTAAAASTSSIPTTTAITTTSSNGGTPAAATTTTTTYNDSYGVARVGLPKESERGGAAAFAAGDGVRQRDGSGRPRAGLGLGVAEQVRQLGHALVRVEGAGHAVQLERPERVLSVLREAVAVIEELRRGNGGADA